MIKEPISFVVIMIIILVQLDYIVKGSYIYRNKNADVYIMRQ
jgi:hypothetical protein